jgi:hypothetical protein
MPNPFHIGKSDLLRSKTVKPGWYVTLIKSVDTVTASTGAAGKKIELVIEGGDFDSVPVTARFWENAPGFAANFVWAVSGKKPDVEGGDYILENSVGKKIKTFIQNKEYQGRTSNEPADYMPLGM